MAYDAAGFQVLRSVASPTAGSNVAIAVYVTNDTMATVMATGYFLTEYAKLPAGSVITITADVDGTPTSQNVVVAASSSTAVTLTPAANSNVVTGTTSADLPSSGIVLLASTAAATYSLSAPTPGCDLLLVRSGATTEVQTVRTASTGVFINYGTGRAAVLDAQNEMIGLRGVTVTQFVADRNIGTVTVTT